MKVGYAFGTEAKQLDEQIKRLQASGCEKIYHDLVTSVNADRPRLQKCLDNLRAGDYLTVCRLDQLCTSTNKALTLLEELYGLEVTFISLDDNFNTKGLTGQVLSHITQVLNTLNANVFKARCREGRKQAISRGVKFGRKLGSVNKDNANKPQRCRQLYDNGLPITRIMTLLNIHSYSTVYRYLKQTGGDKAKESNKLSKKELLKLKRESYDDSHQLDLF